MDLGDVILPTNGYNEVFLIRYNSDGELIWAKHFGTDNFEGYPWEAIGKMDVTNDNKIIIFGMPYNPCSNTTGTGITPARLFILTVTGNVSR
ncbi:MAG: hypothetical protein SH856_08410 [Flavobacteriales bacterium]|nr:hypothetical protein [Flavobacteriales bacterium]